MNYRAITMRLLQEHPQTIAVALARLPEEHSSEIIKLLPSFIQAELINRIVHVDRIPAEIVEEIDLLVSELIKPG